MLYAFIDESYTSTRYYQAAVIVREDKLNELTRLKKEIRQYVVGFGVTAEFELHAHSLMSSADGWEPLADKPRARVSIYKRINGIIAGLPIRVFIEGVDIPRLHERYHYPETPHTVTLRHLLEEIQTFAVKHDEKVTVICDEIGDAKVHQRDFEFYKVRNTSGYKPSRLENLESLSFEKSHEHEGIQVADQIVYLFRRLDAHTETDQRTKAAVQAMWASLRPVIVKHRRWDP